MPTSGERILILDGPHAGISSYPNPVPARLMCLDTDFCYHEYKLVDALRRTPAQYVYLGPVGKPRWAAWATRPENIVFPQANDLR